MSPKKKPLETQRVRGNFGNSRGVLKTSSSATVLKSDNFDDNNNNVGESKIVRGFPPSSTTTTHVNLSSITKRMGDIMQKKQKLEGTISNHDEEPLLQQHTAPAARTANGSSSSTLSAPILQSKTSSSTEQRAMPASNKPTHRVVTGGAQSSSSVLPLRVTWGDPKQTASAPPNPTTSPVYYESCTVNGRQWQEGDFVLYRPSERDNASQIFASQDHKLWPARILALFADNHNAPRFEAQRLYFPSQTAQGVLPFHGSSELLTSAHFIEDSVALIEKKCEVLSFDTFHKRCLQKAERNDRLFYTRDFYDHETSLIFPGQPSTISQLPTHGSVALLWGLEKKITQSQPLLTASTCRRLLSHEDEVPSLSLSEGSLQLFELTAPPPSDPAPSQKKSTQLSSRLGQPTKNNPPVDQASVTNQPSFPDPYSKNLLLEPEDREILVKATKSTGSSFVRDPPPVLHRNLLAEPLSFQLSDQTEEYHQLRIAKAKSQSEGDPLLQQERKSSKLSQIEKKQVVNSEKLQKENEKLSTPLKQQIEKPLKQIEKPFKKIEKPLKQQIEKPLKQQIEKPLKQQIEKPLKQQTEKPLKQQIEECQQLQSAKLNNQTGDDPVLQQEKKSSKLSQIEKKQVVNSEKLQKENEKLAKPSKLPEQPSKRNAITNTTKQSELNQRRTITEYFTKAPKRQPALAVPESISSDDDSVQQKRSKSVAPSSKQHKTAPAHLGISSSEDLTLPGSVVWGKIHDYPWWPALVLTQEDVPDVQLSGVVPIAFFGEMEIGLVKPHKMKPIDDDDPSRNNSDPNRISAIQDARQFVQEISRRKLRTHSQLAQWYHSIARENNSTEAPEVEPPMSPPSDSIGVTYEVDTLDESNPLLRFPKAVLAEPASQSPEIRDDVLDLTFSEPQDDRLHIPAAKKGKRIDDSNDDVATPPPREDTETRVPRKSPRTSKSQQSKAAKRVQFQEFLNERIQVKLNDDSDYSDSATSGGISTFSNSKSEPEIEISARERRIKSKHSKKPLSLKQDQQSRDPKSRTPKEKIFVSNYRPPVTRKESDEDIEQRYGQLNTLTTIPHSDSDSFSDEGELEDMPPPSPTPVDLPRARPRPRDRDPCFDQAVPEQIDDDDEDERDLQHFVYPKQKKPRQRQQRLPSLNQPNSEFEDELFFTQPKTKYKLTVGEDDLQDEPDCGESLEDFVIPDDQEIEPGLSQDDEDEETPEKIYFSKKKSSRRHRIILDSSSEHDENQMELRTASGKMDTNTAFHIYLQFITSCYLEEDFIEQRDSPQFRVALRKIQDLLMIKEQVRSSVWPEAFLRAIKSYPLCDSFEVPKADAMGTECQVCQRHRNEGKFQLNLYGTKYNSDKVWLHESLPPSIEETSKKARNPHVWKLGKTCLENSLIYHKVQHYKYRLFQKVEKKIGSIHSQKTIDQALEQVLDDKEFVKQEWIEFQALIREVEKFQKI